MNEHESYDYYDSKSEAINRKKRNYKRREKKITVFTKFIGSDIVIDDKIYHSRVGEILDDMDSVREYYDSC